MGYIRKKVLISGGSSGIGLALAKQYSSRGADVTILARNIDKLKSAQQQILESRIDSQQIVHIISSDVGNFADLKRKISKFDQPVDILINSAGITHPGRFIDLEAEIFTNIITTNYLGTVYLTKLIVPGMIQNKSGHIVNISSLAALVGIFGYTAYAPSKYAIRGFSRCLRSELKPYGVDVSIVLPPDTDTPQLEFERKIMPETTKKINKSAGKMNPNEVAKIIIKGVEKKKFTIIPGLEGKLLYLLAPFIGRYLYYFAVKEEKRNLGY